MSLISPHTILIHLPRATPQCSPRQMHVAHFPLDNMCPSFESNSTVLPWAYAYRSFPQDVFPLNNITHATTINLAPTWFLSSMPIDVHTRGIKLDSQVHHLLPNTLYNKLQKIKLMEIHDFPYKDGIRFF